MCDVPSIIVAYYYYYYYYYTEEVNKEATVRLTTSN
jgi:hypothetical protein